MSYQAILTQNNKQVCSSDILTENMSFSAMLSNEYNCPTEIVDYWNERAVTYSRGICKELGGERYAAWERVLARSTQEIRRAAQAQGRDPRALDLGCGPGFFSILLARMGCRIDAVDVSAAMLEEARQNSERTQTIHRLSFHKSNIEKLPFASNSFDLIVLRNVTWLMTNPYQAYAEWQRVLIPGGKLIIFDANWYRYLTDSETNAQRLQDESRLVVSKQEVNGFASDAQELQCERIARTLPLTTISRPDWDMQALSELGFSQIYVDKDIWQTVWTEEECACYGSSPLFLIEAYK